MISHFSCRIDTIFYTGFSKLAYIVLDYYDITRSMCNFFPIFMNYLKGWCGNNDAIQFMCRKFVAHRKMNG